MKKLASRIIILLTGILLLIPSCDDNGRSLGDFYISIATVVPEGNNAYSFILDNGKTLWPAAGNVRYSPNYNQRVFINFTILYDNMGKYDYGVKVNEIWNILTKPVIELNAENKDSIGNDPIIIKDIWVGGDYLNVSFLFNYGGVRPHAVNLVENTMAQDETSDKVALEFRHNSFGSTQTRLTEGFVCFDLKQFRKEDADRVEFSIKVKEYDKEKSFDVVYNYKQTSEAASKVPTPLKSSNEYY